MSLTRKHSASNRPWGLLQARSIRAAIVAWRRDWELTQSQAATALGVPRATFIKWEQGIRHPRGLALELLKTKLQNPPES